MKTLKLKINSYQELVNFVQFFFNVQGQSIDNAMNFDAAVDTTYIYDIFDESPLGYSTIIDKDYNYSAKIRSKFMRIFKVDNVFAVEYNTFTEHLNNK